MVNVIFFSSWANPESYLKDTINILTPNGDGVWPTIIGVSDVNAADYYIILDEETKDSLPLDNSKKIYLQREPPYIKPIRSNLTGYHFIGTYNNLHHVGVPWILKPYEFLAKFKYTKRNKKLVTIVSNKGRSAGHRKRLEFARILARGNVDVDVYGRGLNSMRFGGKYKGELKGKCKFDCLSSYTYSLACENGQIPNYFTEKIIDCYLSLTMPIYWGAPNINEYFPTDSYCVIDINTPQQAVERIESIIATPLTQVQIEALYVARDLVLNKYNIWPAIAEII